MPDKIRYLVKMRGRWRYRPSDDMRAHGFQFITFGAELSKLERDKVLALNDEWDRIRKGVLEEAGPSHPVGSVGEAYLRVLALRRKEHHVEDQPALAPMIESRKCNKGDPDW